MNNAVVNQSFLALAYYKDPAEQLQCYLQFCRPASSPPSDQGSYTALESSGKLELDHFQALKCLGNGEILRPSYFNVKMAFSFKKNKVYGFDAISATFNIKVTI